MVVGVKCFEAGSVGDAEMATKLLWFSGVRCPGRRESWLVCDRIPGKACLFLGGSPQRYD